MATLNSPKRPSNIQKLPKLRGNVVRPTGPAILNVAEIYVGGYGAPPAGFVSGQTSVTEWIAYWALAKIYDDPPDPRVPPFFGGRDWSYQVPKGGRWTRAIGSAVVDFVIYRGNTAIAIRIQTEFFHIFTASRKQAADMVQRVNLSDDMIVVDVYDTALLNDPSGAKAVVAMKRAIGMLDPMEDINPITSGTGLRGSRQRIIA